MHNPEYTTDHPLLDDKQTPQNSSIFQPSIAVDEIFEHMFVQELRDGRLTPKRRKRLVQYAAQMGLSARQAGVLMDRCCQNAIVKGDEPAYGHALRLADPPQPRISEPTRMAIIIAISLVVDTLLICWLW